MRTIFVSDLHLGARHASADAFLSFLERHVADTVYLVGDIIDGRKLRRSWRWHDTYGRILHHLLDMAARGTRLCYVPGNHDDFLRGRDWPLAGVEMADEFEHETADGARLLVTHGDAFDPVEHRGALSRGIQLAYDLLLAANPVVHALPWSCGRRSRHPSFSVRLKRCLPAMSKFVDTFEQRLSAHAHGRSFDGVVCGHVHVPRLTRIGATLYANTGDWIEHNSALLERHDGSLELVFHGA